MRESGRLLIRLLGWLLTPLVALLASFLGAWVGAGLGEGFTSSTVAAWIMLGLGALAGIAAAWGWLRFLRRSPRLQHALEVAPDGTPLAAIEDEPTEKPS